MNRPVDPSATQHHLIGRIDNGVTMPAGDVASHEHELARFVELVSLH